MDLDMSDAFDTDITDVITVKRRVQTLSLGRTVATPVTPPTCYGVVTVAGNNDIARLPQGTTFSRGVSVVTQTKLFAAGRHDARDYLPDIIVWDGSEYQVIHVDHYGHVGSGFYQVLAESVTSQEPQ